MRKPIYLQMYASVTGRVFACIPLPPAFAATEEVRARTLAQPPMPTDKAQLSELMLMRYVAVDAAKIWIKVQGTKVYGEKGSPSVVVSTPLRAEGSDSEMDSSTEGEGDAAGAVTAAEAAAAEAVAKAARAPFLSQDNARIHCPNSDKWAVHHLISSSVWPFGNLLLLAPVSGDMHNVVELAHAQIKKKMQAYSNKKAEAGEDVTIMQCIAKLRRVFRKVITPKWVQATTHRLLTKTLPAVIRGEGSYPSKSVR